MADSQARLRLGLLVDSLIQPQWVYVMLERVLRESHADLVLVVRNQTAKDNIPWYKRLWRARGTLLYSIYCRIEKKLFSVEHDAFAPKDISPLFKLAKQIDVLPKQGKFTDTFPDDTVAQIRAERIDVLLRLGFRILKGEILQSASCGVWSFHHGDPDLHRGGPQELGKSF